MFEQVFKNIDDILYKDPGADSELDYVAQTSWVLFLRYLDKIEKENAEQQQFLNFVLDQYVNKGVGELSDDKLKPLLELKYNTIADAKKVLGSSEIIRETFIGFQKFLYEKAIA